MEGLSEMTRFELLDRVKGESGSRFRNRLDIPESEIRYLPMDTALLFGQDRLVFRFKVRDYLASIEVDGILGSMRDHADDVKIGYSSIRRLLSRAMDDGDVRVDCTCPDFRYRYAYTATKDGFKEGDPEVRPSDETNPTGSGGACKHLVRLLSNKRWVYKYVSLVNVLVKLRPESVMGPDGGD